ncbi:MAG: hypothetical protein AMJ81_13870 [Phycisphaerae bacterium SM23_33]|nr:MAG: hypothetical protein AMJ81_13870 [Phycisphaerae bacterium SM23_33]
MLERGLEEGNLAVAVGAIAALRDTTGAESLITTMDRQGGAQPLVAALNCPTRLVRYMAAETLALARPNRRFTGSHLVVPRLVEAVRQTGAMAVVLGDPDLDHRNKVKDLLRAAGCRVFDADSFGQALQDAQDAGGVDVCFIATNIAGPGFKEAVIRLRTEEILSRLPVVALARLAETSDAREMAKTDPLLLLLAEEETEAAGVQDVLKKIGELVNTLPPEEAADWAIRAAAALRMLADTGNVVYDLTSAVKPLIAALADKRDPVRIAAAGALAPLGAAQSQRAIADLADDAEASEEVRLAGYACLSESVRLFGNQLTEKQIKAIIDVVTAAGSLKLREAAAQALGALNLPSEQIKQLIVTNK